MTENEAKDLADDIASVVREALNGNLKVRQDAVRRLSRTVVRIEDAAFKRGYDAHEKEIIENLRALGHRGRPSR